MRIPSSITLFGLLGLAGCAAEFSEPTPTPAASPQAEPAFDSSSVGPVPLRWTNLVTMNLRDWVRAVNGLNSSAMMGPDTYARPAAAVYLQVEEGAELDETALRAQLDAKGLTLIQLLTPADTGIERVYVLECAAFT